MPAATLRRGRRHRLGTIRLRACCSLRRALLRPQRRCFSVVSPPTPSPSPSAQGGVPTIDCIFADAKAKSKSPILLYTNADIVLLPDMLDAAHTLLARVDGPFVAVGMRRDVSFEHFPARHFLFDLFSRQEHEQHAHFRAVRLALANCRALLGCDLSHQSTIEHPPSSGRLARSMSIKAPCFSRHGRPPRPRQSATTAME